MPIVRKIIRSGHSKGVIVPQPVLQMLGWDEGTQVELHVDGPELILSPVGYREGMTTEEAKKKPRRPRS